MKCDVPFFVNTAKGERVPVPCGRCPPCKMRRVNEWVFRLMQEEKCSLSAHFVTLTYDTQFVPISDNGFLTLRKSDFQHYMMRLRKLCYPATLKYYAVGEYGSQNKRPHFHAIIFNCPDTNYFFDAWKIDGKHLGTIHVGQVTNDSVAYTMKYIDKPTFRTQHSRDDRVPEFSLMSKGLGLCYLTDEVKKYHRSHIGDLYVTKLSGHKVSMPRIYRNRIFNQSEKEQQIGIVQSAILKYENIDREEYRTQYSDRIESYEKYLEMRKQGRSTSFYHNVNKRKL